MLYVNALTYTITYIRPFLIDDFSKSEKFIPALGFYVVMAALMLRTETIYVNRFEWLVGSERSVSSSLRQLSRSMDLNGVSSLSTSPTTASTFS